MMPILAPKLLFLFLFPLLPLFSSGTQVGFSYHAKGNAATSLTLETVSFLNLNSLTCLRVTGLYAQVARRELHTSSHDEISPPNTIFPTTPISDTPFVTVPATNPFPFTTPVTVPVTNPVTTYPAPPASVNPPAGQSWCVANNGAPETSVQAALDYACGIGGADCTQIQQSGSCFNPFTLHNHASYAFNSYYQENPSPSSCDFGGAATITNTNPSTGSCIFPSSSTSAIPSPSISSIPITTPTSSFPGAGVAGSGSSPLLPNSMYPSSGTPTVFGSEIPPSVNSSTISISATLQPFLGCIFLVTSFFTQKLIQW